MGQRSCPAFLWGHGVTGFLDRVKNLPMLGIGVSTEYGANTSGEGLDVAKLRRDYPRFSAFLEVGVEVAKGLDADTRAWRAAGGQTTYHFLDINLDEPADFDPAWLASVNGLITELSPAWLCGDAGLWHFGARDRGQMLLLPPILSAGSADAMAAGIANLRAETGHEVLPENPPGTLFLGDLHLLDFFARVCERGDTGMLLDCAHLAVYQRIAGHRPLDGLEGFPLDRVVELHVAGGGHRDHQGFAWVEDDHSVEVLEDTWAIYDHVVARAPNLRAVVFECERNPLAKTLAGFERIASAWRAAGTP
ncbi:MAG: hypothetical protein ACI9MR_002080 [Myxococcota bacterium]|jgi:uncharacterized protein (UPF0276 family)